MELLYAAADVMVCRAGGMTVAELAVVGVSAVVVPFPAPGDHQTANGRALVDGGAAVLVPDGELDADRLAQEVARLLADANRLAAWPRPRQRVGRRDAADRVAALVEEHARPRRAVRAATGRRRSTSASPGRIHVVGVGGTGMSAIATVLAGMGHQVSGSDLKPSPGLERLPASGCRSSWATTPPTSDRRPPRSTCQSTSSPSPPPSRRQPRGRRRPGPLGAGVGPGQDPRRHLRRAPHRRRHRHPRQDHHHVALRLALGGAGLRPVVPRRWRVLGLDSGTRWDAGHRLVVEADESDGTSSHCHASRRSSSVEPDHLGPYGDPAVLYDAFDSSSATPRPVSSAPTTRARPPSAAAGGPVLRDQLGRRHAHGGGRRRADVVRFDLIDHGRPLGEVEVPLPGLHDARNAAGAISAALLAGAEFGPAVATVAGSAMFMVTPCGPVPYCSGCAGRARHHGHRRPELGPRQQGGADRPGRVAGVVQPG